MTIKLHERKLDFLMTGRSEARRLFLDKRAVNAVAVFLHYFEKFILTGGAVVGYRRFDKVSRAV